jgi:chromosome segregation ATPase
MGDYSASEKKTLGVLEDFPQTLGDEALFLMGLLYALPKNPKADYEKSRAFFEKLLTLHSDSKRKEEAAAWSFAITRIVRCERGTIELQKKLTLLEQAADARGKKLKQLQDELDGREIEMTEHRDAVRQLQNRVMELESQLVKFKNIDLTIEQKKRATVP